MTDEQKVYIRGVEGRGDEVIKMLTDLEGENSCLFNGEDVTKIYFIRHDMEISYVTEDSELSKMVKDYYREIHLPELRKDDDIFVNENILGHFAVNVPAIDALYFYVTDLLSVQAVISTGSDTDLQRFQAGNYFKTKEEALAVAERVKRTIWNFKMATLNDDGKSESSESTSSSSEGKSESENHAS